MGVPQCARCNNYSYAGEVVVDDRRFSLCGYCLPIVKAKIVGFIEDHVRSLEAPFQANREKNFINSINVFDQGAVEDEELQEPGVHTHIDRW